jgi:putative component of membrane protein insertase Oxa1/YidC/SpoIIIJ protein YidD
MKELLKFRRWLFRAHCSMKNKAILIVIILAAISFSQTETERWEKKTDPYLLKEPPAHRDYSLNTSSAGSFMAKAAASVYWFIISDQDGDNCPFSPSCSNFFIQSVSKTDLFQGTIMAADRFTRDMNIFNRREKYPIIKDGRLYDPPELYTINHTIYPPVLK